MLNIKGRLLLQVLVENLGLKGEKVDKIRGFVALKGLRSSMDEEVFKIL